MDQTIRSTLARLKEGRSELYEELASPVASALSHLVPPAFQVEAEAC